jgi:hypothetical protein
MTFTTRPANSSICHERVPAMLLRGGDNEHDRRSPEQQQPQHPHEITGKFHSR